MTITSLLAGVLVLLGATGAVAQDKPVAEPPADAAPAPAIESGSTVQIEYTLTLEDGEVVDSNRGRDPLTYTQGHKQIIAGLETALGGLRAGDAKRVTVKPEDAYGPVNPAAETEVPKDRVPADVVVGTELAARSASGGVRLVRVKEIKDETVVLDLNHPLAGKTLLFDVKVLDVKAPAAPAPDVKAPEVETPDARTPAPGATTPGR